MIEFQLARQRVELRSADPIPVLSPREGEVLDLLVAGHTDAQIADRLFISKKTASVHVSNVKAKLGASSRIETAMLGAHLGLVGSPVAIQTAAARRRRDSVVCPFKGLASFDAADAPYFFGRERTVAEIVAKLAGGTFVGLVGSSGSGKSSVLRAGLLPAVADGVLPGSSRWAVALIRPTATPTAVLATAVDTALAAATGRARAQSNSRSGLDRLPLETRLLVVVDQFEETFTVCPDPVERAAFTRAIVSLAKDPVARVVLAVRADFYDRCASDRELADLMAANQVVIGPMTTDELTRAITLPASAAGLVLEAGLAAALLEDVVDEPGGLPLLSTALLDLWQRRDGRRLSLAAYELMGGVTGSVARLAESALIPLSENEQAIARGVLLRLTMRAPETHLLVRRPVPVDEFDGERDAGTARVLERLIDSRLLTLTDGTVELAHEALLVEWPRLRAWLDVDGEDRRVREHLRQAAREWADEGRRDADLYRAGRFAAASDWADRHGAEMNDLERRFLDASRRAGEEDAERQRRVNRRLRTLLAGAVIFLCVAILAGAFAALQLRQAEEERQRAADAAARAAQAALAAEDARDVARSRELAALAASVLPDDPGLSKMLLIEAARLAELQIESLADLHRALASDYVIDRYVWAGSGDETIVTNVDPTGELIVATRGYGQSGHGRLEVVDRIADRVLWAFEPAQGLAVGIGHFLPDGRHVVVGVYRDPFGSLGTSANDAELGIHVFDSRSGAPVGPGIDVGPCGGIVTAASALHVLVRTKPAPTCFLPPPDPRHVLELVDLGSGERRELSSALVSDGESDGDRLSANGAVVAFDDETGSVVMDAATGEQLLLIERSEFQGIVRDVSADGSLVLHGDNPMRVWDIRSTRPTGVQLEGWHYGAAFGPSGEELFATAEDGSLRKVSATGGTEELVLPGIGTRRPSIANGGIVVVAGSEAPGALIVRAGAHGDRDGIEARSEGRYDSATPATECFVSTGSLTVVGGHGAFADLCSGPEAEHTTQIVDIESASLRLSLPGGGGAHVAVDATGRTLARQEATGRTYGGIALRDLATGDVLVELEGLCAYDNGPASPENTGGCSAFPDTPFPIWVLRLRFSPDGSMIAAVPAPADGWGGFVAVWKTADGSLVPTPRFEPGVYAMDAIFTPDSDRLLVSFMGGRVQAFSTETWGAEPEVMSAQLPVDQWFALLGSSGDGSPVHAVSGLEGTGSGALHWLDPVTLQQVRPSRGEIHLATPLTAALSPDGGTIATAAADGSIRLWDAASGRLVHEIHAEDRAVKTVAFVDDLHLVAIHDDGNPLIFTIDPDELLAIARTSVTRTFTASECDRFRFTSCPTLQALRGG